MRTKQYASRRFFLDAIQSVCTATLGLTVVLWLLLATQALLSAPVLPGPPALAQLSIGLIPSVLAIALPLGLLFGCTATAWHWRIDGEFLALHASGLGGRNLLPAMLSLGFIFGVAEGSLTHILEPMGRRAATKALVHSTQTLQIQPLQPTMIGDVLIHAETIIDGRAEHLTLARDGQVAVATTGEISTSGRLNLSRGEIISLQEDANAPLSWQMRFEEASIPLEAPVLRLDPPTLTQDELLARIQQMEDEGGNSWVEQTTWYKRTVLPLTLPILAILGLCLGARGGRPALTASSIGLSWWAIMRICDHAVPTIGALNSVLLPLGALMLALCVCWRGWTER